MNRKIVDFYNLVKNDIETFHRICFAGIDNHSFVLNYDNEAYKKRNFKAFLYYLIILPINKKQTITSKIVSILGGKQRKNNFSKELPCHVYHGRWFESISDIRYGFTVMSPFSIIERFRIIISALSLAKKSRGFWVDFYCIACFLYVNEIERVNGRGHYDFLATWLGMLSRTIGFKYYIYQHGIQGAVPIPHKYPCDCLYLFDEYAKSAFQSSIISNSDCKYVIYKFPPSVLFKEIEKKHNYLYVGLVEQGHTTMSWITNMLTLLNSYANIITYIMLHPNSQEKYTSSKSAIYTDDKIFNLDIIISENSTLLLDYVNANYSGELIITQISAADIFSAYPSIRLIADMQKLQLEIEKMLSIF